MEKSTSAHEEKLTGIKHLDYKILNKLTDVELVSFFSTNKHYLNFCNNNQEMWMKRVLSKFKLDKNMPDENRMKIHRNQKGNRTWSQYYIEDLSRFNKSNINLNDALVASSKNGDLASVMTAIEKGADIHHKDDFSLKLAVSYGHYDIVKYLVENKANVHAGYEYPLKRASQDGHLDIVKILVENGAAVSYNNETPMELAILGGHLNVVKYLVDNGADINSDYNYDYNIETASENGHLDIIKYLVENGENKHTHNENALDHASLNGHLNVVKFLVENGANVKAKNNALESASINGHLDIVKYLTKNTVYEKSVIIRSIDNAKDSGHSDVVKYLKNYL